MGRNFLIPAHLLPNSGISRIISSLSYRGPVSLGGAMTKRVRIQTAGVLAGRVSWLLHLPVVVSFAVLLSCLCFSPSVADSEIYKWKDNNGNVIFSDSPPSGSNAEKVKIKNNLRFEMPPSKEDDGSKTIKKNNPAEGQRLRDARDINVVLYMTDW
jgi:hypothetical protein